MGGLSKHVDIVIRFWSESVGRVVDVYIDTHSFGREPADKQVRLTVTYCYLVLSTYLVLVLLLSKSLIV